MQALLVVLISVTAALCSCTVSQPKVTGNPSFDCDLTVVRIRPNGHEVVTLPINPCGYKV